MTHFVWLSRFLIFSLRNEKLRQGLVNDLTNPRNLIPGGSPDSLANEMALLYNLSVRLSDWALYLAPLRQLAQTLAGFGANVTTFRGCLDLVFLWVLSSVTFNSAEDTGLIDEWKSNGKNKGFLNEVERLAIKAANAKECL